LIVVRVSHWAAIALSVALIGSVSAAQHWSDDTEVNQDVRAFYERNAHRTVWVDAGGHPTTQARKALIRLEGAAEDGLDVDEYRGVELAGEATALDQAQAPLTRDVAAFEVGLTASMLRYFRHLHLGRVDPRAVGFHLDHRVEPHDFADLLQNAVVGNSLDQTISELRPAFAQYGGLKRALKDSRDRAAAGTRQIELAMERLRWLPDLTGERVVVVNIPTFSVWGWDIERSDGVPAIGMAAIIGRAGTTRTPVFAAAMTSIVFNPSWNVPDSIIRNEILPALARDPDYLRRHHMEMSGTAGTVRVRQLPGPWNALGRIKFDLPNPFDVYLHGTPAQELFNRPRRDFSHGCVRVEDPISLAEWLLKGQADWTRDRIHVAIERGATSTVALAQPTRVVLFYMTAEFAPADGTVRFADDVYGHDARLEAWLRASAEGGE
jgi:murein L,D-transpeptidase YcbB/YkuD